MLEKNKYEEMLQRYGSVGSWAIWEPAIDTPRSNTSNMAWVNSAALLDTVNTGFVFVGLNWSSTHGDQDGERYVPWRNFHSGYSRQNDYKLRYAFQGTRYWGSYITDLIKLYAEVDSRKVKRYIKEHPDVVRKNIVDFEKEISFLGNDPILVAFGKDVYRVLKQNLGYKYRIVFIKHYSYAIGKENYRKEILGILDSVERPSCNTD